jgi:anti-sigma B factor antagonist
MIEVHVDDEKTKITYVISGRLDAEQSPELEAHLKRVTIPVREIVFDFAGVTYVSSMGLRIVLVAYKLMHSRGGTFRMINIPDAVKDVFELTGFMKTFERDEILVIVQKEKGLVSATYALIGTLDKSTASILKKELMPLSGTNGTQKIDLDCAELTDIDAQGIDAIKKTVAALPGTFQLTHTSEALTQKIVSSGGGTLLSKAAREAEANAPTSRSSTEGLVEAGNTLSYTCLREWQFLCLPCFHEPWFPSHAHITLIVLVFTQIPNLSADPFSQISVLKTQAAKHGVKVTAHM